MTDPLIELARKSVPTIWCRNDIVLRCAADAMKAQQAMIVKWMRGLYQNSSLAEHVEEIADAIEQGAYLKGRG